ncbi:hypothetical protein BDY24DRAFT_415798 [Mrakia frigida]|uniref:uncharacterized protein n=1 Tax=Mrakia frigida TaxID=29902 RepID=UPI003FCC0C24
MAATKLPTEIWTKIFSLAIASPLFLAHVRLLRPGDGVKFEQTLVRWHQELGSDSPALKIRSLSYDPDDNEERRSQIISHDSERDFLSILRFLPKVDSIHFVGSLDVPPSILVALSARNRPLSSLTGVSLGSTTFSSLVALLLAPAGSSLRRLGIKEGSGFQSYTSTFPPTPSPFTCRTPFPSLQTLTFGDPSFSVGRSLAQDLLVGWSFPNLQRLHFKGRQDLDLLPSVDTFPSTIRFLSSSTVDNNWNNTLLARLELEEFTIALGPYAPSRPSHARLDLLSDSLLQPTRPSVKSLVLTELPRIRHYHSEFVHTPDLFTRIILPRYPSLRRLTWVTSVRAQAPSTEWIQDEVGRAQRRNNCFDASPRYDLSLLTRLELDLAEGRSFASSELDRLPI